MSESIPRYTLSATLLGHSSDVKSVVFPNKSTIATASRDGSVRLWKYGVPEGTSSDPHWNSNVLHKDTPYINSISWFDDAESCMYIFLILFSGHYY